MGNLVYSMSVTLDGYIAGPDGSFAWGRPDDELHAFHNDRVRKSGVQLLGRRLYETMAYWEADDPEWGPVERDFAAIWQPLPKVVFSSTLREEELLGRTRLAAGTVAEEVERARREAGDADVAIGGAGLAAACVEQDLIDEYHLFVCPVIVGGGTPYFPAHGRQLDLELADTRTFAGGVVHLRHVRRR